MLNNVTLLQYFTLLSLIHSKSSIDVENNERCIINSITVMQMNAFPSILNLNKKYSKPKERNKSTKSLILENQPLLLNHWGHFLVVISSQSSSVCHQNWSFHFLPIRKSNLYGILSTRQPVSYGMILNNHSSVPVVSL